MNGTPMSVTTTSAPANTNYHRDEHGLQIECPQQYDAATTYLHYVESTHTEGEKLLITTLCGTTRAPIAEDFFGPHNDGQLVCPRCYLEKIFRR